MFKNILNVDGFFIHLELNSSLWDEVGKEDDILCREKK
jgi:hypothetical protein